ncbi:MAG TPA: enoyl-CoA hydratase/isomerase family protein [Casimicrobiaceae bacterium]
MDKRSDVSFNVDDGIGIVTIDRPEVRNALRHATLEGLQAAIDAIEQTPSVRAGVLIGAGGLAFSAGADLKALHQANPDRRQVEQFMVLGQQTCAKIWASEKPMVAAIDGYALGGGLEIALSCHQRLATVRSRLGLPEIKLRHLPAWGGISRLVKLTTTRTLFSLVLTGEAISGTEAERSGIVDELCEPEQLLAKARNVAVRLSTGDSDVVRRGLEIIRTCMETNQPAILAMEQWAAGIAFDSQEHRREVDRFVNARRAP